MDRKKYTVNEVVQMYKANPPTIPREWIFVSKDGCRTPVYVVGKATNEVRTRCMEFGGFIDANIRDQVFGFTATPTGWRIVVLEQLPLSTVVLPTLWSTENAILETVEDAGLTRVTACCDVPDKFCDGDEWRGPLRAALRRVETDRVDFSMWDRIFS